MCLFLQLPGHEEEEHVCASLISSDFVLVICFLPREQTKFPTSWPFTCLFFPSRSASAHLTSSRWTRWLGLSARLQPGGGCAWLRYAWLRFASRSVIRSLDRQAGRQAVLICSRCDALRIVIKAACILQLRALVYSFSNWPSLSKLSKGSFFALPHMISSQVSLYLYLPTFYLRAVNPSRTSARRRPGSSFFLPVCLSVCLYVCMSVCLYVCETALVAAALAAAASVAAAFVALLSIVVALIY